MGGWPQDYAASDIPLAGRAARFGATLTTMRAVWRGELSGAAGPMPVLLGGLVPAAFTRVVAMAAGWVSPFFGMELLRAGNTAVRREWAHAGRVREEIGRLADAGADDLVLFPCSGDLEQVDLLADAIHMIG